MADSYTRQTSFASGDVILADHGNLEFNQIVRAFHETSGHTHDGTLAGGSAVPLLKDPSGTHDLTLTPTGISGTVIDTDTTMAGDSDTRIPSQKAVKAFVASGRDRLLSATGASNFIISDIGVTSTHIKDDSNLTTASSVKLVTERAIKAALDTKNNITAEGQSITVGSTGIGGTLVEHSTTLPIAATTKLPTVAAVKGHVTTAVAAQDAARVAQAAVDLAARNVIIATADSDRATTVANKAQVTVDIDAAILASEAKPHVGKLQQAIGGGTSSVECALTKVEVLGPAVELEALSGLALLSSTGGNTDVTSTNNINVAAGLSASLTTANGALTATATGGAATLKSFTHNTTVDSTLGSTLIDGQVSTTLNARGGDVVVSSTAGNATLTSPNATVLSGGTMALTGVTIVVNGALSGSAIDNDNTMAANSASVVPTQQAAKSYIDNLIATSSAPVNTASVNITGSTTALGPTSLTIDGPADTTRGGRINLQAGTSDDDVNDVWLQKVNNTLVLGQLSNDNHYFSPNTVGFNLGSTYLTSTTSTLPGFSWDTSTATVGSNLIATFASTGINLQNASQVITPSSVVLMANDAGGRVELDATQATFLNDLHAFSPTTVSLFGGDVLRQSIIDANGATFLNNRVQFLPASTYLNSGAETFTSTQATFLGGASWLTTTDAQLGGGSLNLTASAFNLHQAQFAINKANGETYVNKEINSEVGSRALILQNLNDSADVSIRTGKGLISQEVFGAKGNVLGTYGTINYDGSVKLQTSVNGITIIGNGGNTFQLNHDGSTLLMDNTTAGDILIRNQAAGGDLSIQIAKPNGTLQQGLQCFSDAGGNFLRSYFDNTGRMDTASEGVLVNGPTASRMYLGHTGTSGYLSNIDSGDMSIRNNVSGQALKLEVEDSIGILHSGVILNSGTAPNVELFYDDSSRLATTAAGISINNSGYNMEISKTPTGNGTISNSNSGDLVLRNEVSGGNVYIQARNTAGTLIDSLIAYGDAGTNLYHAGTFRLATTSQGLTVAGVGNKQFNLKHDGSSAYLQNVDSGPLLLQNEVNAQTVNIRTRRTDGSLYNGLTVGGATNIVVSQFFDEKAVSTTTATGLKIGWSGYGTVDIGPQNTSWCHFTTDRPAYLFNKGIALSTGNVYDTNGHYTLGAGSLQLSSGRQALRDSGDGYLYAGEGYVNGVYTPNNIRTDSLLQVGASGASFSVGAGALTWGGTNGLKFNVSSTALTYNDIPIVNEKSIYATTGTYIVSNVGARSTKYNTWTGSYTFNIDPIATLTLGSEFIFHKSNVTSDITINLTGANNNSLYGPWGTSDSTLTIPAGTSGSITLRYVSTNIIMTTLNLTNHN